MLTNSNIGTVPFIVSWGFVGGTLIILASINSTAVIAAYLAYLILVVTILNSGEKALTTIGFTTSGTSNGTAKGKYNF